MHGITNHIIL